MTSISLNTDIYPNNLVNILESVLLIYFYIVYQYLDIFLDVLITIFFILYSVK